jgi:hypothetical protein
MPRTVGQNRERDLELRSLEQIAAALALPELRKALARTYTERDSEEMQRTREMLLGSIRQAEGRLGIPRAAQSHLLTEEPG